jgi:hypothetical protein
MFFWWKRSFRGSTPKAATGAGTGTATAGGTSASWNLLVSLRVSPEGEMRRKTFFKQDEFKLILR